MKPKQRRIFLFVALLLALLAIFVGRWLFESTPEIAEVSHVDPERDPPARKANLEQPAPPKVAAPPASQQPMENSLEPAIAKMPDAPQAGVPAPIAEAPKSTVTGPPPDTVVVTYGVQVFVAATIDENTLGINGEFRTNHPAPEESLASERFFFVTEQSPGERDLDPSTIVRGYTACGIDATHGWRTTSDQDGNIATQSHQLGPEFLSDLLGSKARKGPTGSIVLLGGEQEREQSGALWDLGLSTFLPPGHVVSGSKWIVPAASFAHVVSPGSDLLLRKAPHAVWEEVAITPGGAPTQPQLGSWTGDSIVTYEGKTLVGSRERHAARIAIDVTGKSDDESLGQLFVDNLLTGVHPKSKGTVKVDTSYTGRGIVAWYEDDLRPPISEIRCTFSANVELHLDVQGVPIDCTYRIHGQLAYLAGMTVRDNGYWNQMWQPREAFLARESFTIR